MTVQRHQTSESNEMMGAKDAPMVTSRRVLLAAIGLAPFIFGAAAQAQAATSCVDPSKLPLAQKRTRAALGFQEASKDPKRRCGLCAFFTATNGSCGTCRMLSNGPVDAGSVCMSFAPKAS